MNVYVTNMHRDQIQDFMINEIIESVCGVSLPVQRENVTRVGRYINFEYDGVMYYVVLSASEEQGRNTYIQQYLPPVFKAQLDYEGESRMFSYYIPGSASDITTDYHINVERMIKTIGIEVINESEVFLNPVTPYTRFSDFRTYRVESRRRRRNNASTYIINNGDTVSIYGKLYGANKMEAALLALVTKELLNEEEIIFYPVKDHGVEEPSETLKSILEDSGITIDTSLYEIERTGSREAFEKEIRNQAAFTYNLAQKFEDKECYLCDCKIEKAIVASHLHRVTDIKHSTLSFEEKLNQAKNGENGLWLCGTHDKLFEYGYIYFEGKELKINQNISQEKKDYIESITKYRVVKDEHFTEEMEQFLEFHKNRVTIL